MLLLPAGQTQHTEKEFSTSVTWFSTSWRCATLILYFGPPDPPPLLSLLGPCNLCCYVHGSMVNHGRKKQMCKHPASREQEEGRGLQPGLPISGLSALQKLGLTGSPSSLLPGVWPIPTLAYASALCRKSASSTVRNFRLSRSCDSYMGGLRMNASSPYICFQFTVPLGHSTA